MEGKYLKEDLFSSGVVGLNDVVEWTINIKDDSEYPIEYITRSCGSCTRIKEVDPEKGYIKGELDVSAAGIPEEPGNHTINRVVIVYFKDGQNEFIADNNYNRISNPKKAKERFTITGTVKIE